MFFESSYYASPHIEDLLKKENVKLTEFLDDDEILQEYKSQNKNLVQYFHRPDIVDQLVTMIVTEPPNTVSDTVRFKHPNIACEILTTETPDMTERLIENQPVLQKLYSFLEQDAPLNPLLTSFFSKTFGMLIVRKSEQNWFSYQCVCIQVLEFIKTRDRFLETMFKHVASPAIMDLLFQIIVNVEGPDLKSNLFNWLNEQNMVPRLINILGCDSDPEKHYNVAYFVCELVSHSRSFRQADLVERCVQKNDDTGMLLLHALEAPSVTSALLDIILMDSNRESTIVAGLRIILKLLETPLIYERDVSIARMVELAEKDHRNRLLERLLPQIASRIREFHHLLLNVFDNTIQTVQQPFGQTRLQICVLLTTVLRTGNASIEKAICATDFFVTLVDLFEKYCWNNLLHNQVRTCLMYALEPPLNSDASLTTLQEHIIVKCGIVTKLINCWIYNKDQIKPSMKRGAQLGYMGHLIDILNLLVTSCRTHYSFRSLVEESLTPDKLVSWKQISGLESTSSNVSENVSTNICKTDNFEDPVAAPNLNAEKTQSMVLESELDVELKLQKVLLAGIDPYEKNETIFLSTDYDQDFIVDPEASERFAQACISKDINTANIDDILSGMLTIEDDDLFPMNDDDDEDDENDDNNMYNNLTQKINGPNRQLNRSNSDSSNDFSDEGFETCRLSANVFNQTHNDDDNDFQDDYDADDDNRSHNRQRHHRMAALQQRRSQTSLTVRKNQLIIDSGDDNANVHSIDNLKLTNNFDISPWDTHIGHDTHLFTNEVNFEAHFTDAKIENKSAEPSNEEIIAGRLEDVSTVFDSIDPFSSFEPSNDLRFMSDESVKFDDVFDAPVDFAVVSNMPDQKGKELLQNGEDQTESVTNSTLKDGAQEK